MKIQYGEGKTKYGPGVSIQLTGDEIATAIDAYLVAHNVHINGPRTISIRDELIGYGEIYVDPSGFVIDKGRKLNGRGIEMNLEQGTKMMEHYMKELRDQKIIV